MLPALCLSDNATSCLRSAGSRTLVCDDVANMATSCSSISSSSSSKRPAPCHHYPLRTPPHWPSLVSQRVGAVKVRDAAAAAATRTHTHTRSVPVAARHSPGASVRACIHLRLTTERSRRPTDHTCCPSVRPYVRSARLMCTVMQPTNRTRQNDVTCRHVRPPARVFSDVTDEANFLSG